MTAVVVLKARAGKAKETLRLPGVCVRHEPQLGRIVVHQDGHDIACISTDALESWSIEPE